MKLTILSLAVFLSLNAFAQDVEELDTARLTLVVKRTLKIPGAPTYNELLPLNAGLVAVKGKPACALSVIPAEIQRTYIASGTKFGVQGIVKDPFSDSQTYIVAPDGIFGLAITCVKKLKTVDRTTGALLGSPTATPLLLAEMREALKGVLEVRY
jgi:hypothetical protein